MGYQILITAGKRRYQKILGLALTFVAALHKKNTPVVMETDVGDDALIYTRGKRVLAFAKQWVKVFEQVMFEGHTSRLGAPGYELHIEPRGNVLIRAFKNGVTISIRQADGSWTSADGSATHDEVIIPEFQAHTPALYSMRAVYVVKSSADGKKICLLANITTGLTAYTTDFMTPVSLEYSGSWQATLPEYTSATVSSTHEEWKPDAEDYQTVAALRSGRLYMWSCRDADAWYAQKHDVIGKGLTVDGWKGMFVNDGIVLFAAQNYGEWIGTGITGAAIEARVYVAGSGEFTETFNSGVITCSAGARVINFSSGTMDYITKCHAASSTATSYGCAFIMATTYITSHSSDASSETWYGTATATWYGIGPNGAVAQIDAQTYSGALITRNHLVGVYGKPAPDASIAAADYFDPAIRTAYGNTYAWYFRDVQGSWVAAPDPNYGWVSSGGYIRLAPGFRASYYGSPGPTTTLEWNGSESITGYGYAIAVRCFKNLPHGTYAVSRIMDADLLNAAVYHNPYDDEFDAAVLIQEPVGQFTKVCTVSGVSVTPGGVDLVLSATSPSHNVVAVMWSPSKGEAFFDIYWKQGSGYERIYRSRTMYVTSAGFDGSRAVLVSANGSLVLFSADNVYYTYKVKFGELEPGEQRVVAAEYVSASGEPPVLDSVLDGMGDDTNEGAFFHGAENRAFQTIAVGATPFPGNVLRPTVIEPDEGEPYMYGYSGTILENRLAKPSNDA